MSFTIDIKLKDIVYFVIIAVVYFTTSLKFNEKISNIEKRLKEVCFLYNDGCDSDIGGCECISRASKYDINYILKK